MLQLGLFFLLLIVCSVFLGNYCGKVMNGERSLLYPVLRPLERLTYRLLHIQEEEEMDWKTYALCAVLFNVLGMAALFLLGLLQGILPLNPEGIAGMNWDLAFNTALSFATNTDWQAYSGETQASYLTQMLGMTVQNFASAGTAIAVLFAVIRGFQRAKQSGIGNFWVDLIRTFFYLLLPFSIALALILVSQGVPQNLSAYTEGELLKPVEIEVEAEDGSVTTETITKTVIPQGPAASQIAIKQVGTNGGGFYGVNSAHPLENPNQVSNFFEMFLILLVPMALCFTFGRNVGDKRQGRAIFAAMLVLLLISVFVIVTSETNATPQLAQNGAVDASAGNLEGKETRAGVVNSSAWIASISATSNGSVNAMIDSFTPLGGMMSMLNIMLGEVIFGGVGCGLYGMLGFVLAAVFIAALMVGRTPEYLGKKLTPEDTRLAMLICLTVPVGILVGSAIAVLYPAITDSLTNSGVHGLSEILYAYSSAGGNNGSAFGGLSANTVFLNVTLGLIILVGRYVPMICALALAGSFAAKKKMAKSAGTLETCSPLFVLLLILVVLIIGGLSFFPALSLGPIAEFTEMLG